MKTPQTPQDRLTIFWPLSSERVLIAALIVASVLATMSASQSHAYYAINGGAAPPWLQSILFSASQWYACALFVPCVFSLATRYNFLGNRRWSHALLHGAAALVFVGLTTAIQTALIWSSVPGGRAFLGQVGAGALTLLVSTLHVQLLSYVLVVSSAHVVLYLDRSQNEAARRERAETFAVRAQMSALQRQMQPHFLFNSLNALVSMQPEGSPAQVVTIRLAALFRRLLNHDDVAVHTLKTELSMVEDYLSIERIRLGCRLQAVVDVPTAALHAPLPSFILQPLIENAITYGVAPDPGGGTIRLSARYEPDQLLVEIVNSFRLKAGDLERPNNGVAMENCRRRLALMYGNRARFESGPLDADQFRVAIILPGARQ